MNHCCAFRDCILKTRNFFTTIEKFSNLIKQNDWRFFIYFYEFENVSQFIPFDYFTSRKISLSGKLQVIQFLPKTEGVELLYVIEDDDDNWLFEKKKLFSYPQISIIAANLLHYFNKTIVDFASNDLMSKESLTLLSSKVPQSCNYQIKLYESLLNNWVD